METATVGVALAGGRNAPDSTLSGPVSGRDGPTVQKVLARASRREIVTPKSPTVRYTPDPDEELSVAIVEALSAAKGRDITEDECVLYRNIDPDSLDRLFRQEGSGDTIKVEFTTHDAVVLLWGNGDISIEVQDFEGEPNYE